MTSFFEIDYSQPSRMWLSIVWSVFVLSKKPHYWRWFKIPIKSQEKEIIFFSFNSSSNLQKSRHYVRYYVSFSVSHKMFYQISELLVKFTFSQTGGCHFVQGVWLFMTTLIIWVKRCLNPSFGISGTYPDKILRNEQVKWKKRKLFSKKFLNFRLSCLVIFTIIFSLKFSY